MLFQVFAIVALLLPLYACSPNGIEAREPPGRETARVTSPDSAVDAVVIVNSVDATTAFVHRVYVVPRGAAVPTAAREGEVFRADYVTNLGLRWPRSGMLELAYDTARIFQFTNFWNSRAVDDFAYVVEVRLAPRHSSALPRNAHPGSSGG